MTATLCRDCAALSAAPAMASDGPGRCPECGSPRRVAHPELAELAIAHLDCDAFYATVEKRDRPELAELPVIVGGGARGVVLACCYVARLYGVRSAMPMFKALPLCPDAVVIRPDMAKYRVVGRAVRAEMERLTPLVEPLSLKTADFRLRSRSRRLADPTQLFFADTLYRTARLLLAGEVDDATRFRLIGVGADGLDRPRHLEKAIDDIRRRHGPAAARLGRGLPQG